LFTLREPLLYLSLYFKQHRQQYYDLLQSVRLTGDWEAWLRFFLTGVEETANQAGHVRPRQQTWNMARHRDKYSAVKRSLSVVDRRQQRSLHGSRQSLCHISDTTQG
jgi:Fic family protein